MSVYKNLKKFPRISASILISKMCHGEKCGVFGLWSSPGNWCSAWHPKKKVAFIKHGNAMGNPQTKRQFFSYGNIESSGGIASSCGMGFIFGIQTPLWDFHHGHINMAQLPVGNQQQFAMEFSTAQVISNFDHHSYGWVLCLPIPQWYPLGMADIAMERSTIFNGKIHYFYGHFQ